MNALSTPPWHMWGNSDGINFPVPSGQTGIATSNGQLAHVDYKRPDTWQFFLSCAVTNFVYQGAAVPALDVYFNLTLGVGRGSTTISGFEHYHWDLPAEVGIVRYSTEVIGPPRVTGSTDPNITSEFPAQQINCTYRATLFVPAGADATCAIQVAAYFAPKTHIRPEWFEQIAKYNGGEDRGK